MDTQLIQLAVIGTGGRGRGLIQHAICKREGVRITAVCDIVEEHARKAADIIRECDGNEPLVLTDYREVLKLDCVDAVVIATGWETHIPISIAAMEAGKIVGCEVCGAYSVEECWELVRTQERTGVPLMLLENCCYGRDELMVLNMVRQGVLGNVVHCRGGYQHDLRSFFTDGEEAFRVVNYQKRNCENYPTHDLGPIAKVLGINRGNRMESLVSVASCAKGFRDFVLSHENVDKKFLEKPFRQGDVVTTIITCAGGETITLNLSCTLPRYYSRGFEVHGTKGMYTEDNRSIFLDDIHNEQESDWKQNWNNVEQYREQYDHPIWKRNLKEGARGGHGGMDGLVFDAFFTAIREGRPMPIDVYDMAAWMCITALSEQSIAQGGAPMAIPDFTRGKWTAPDAQPEWDYSL